MAYNPNTKTVDAISELKTLKGVVSTAARVQTLGGAAAGDGKGGMYYWNNTSTATDDGINIISVTGVSTGRYIRMISNGPTFSNEEFII